MPFPSMNLCHIWDNCKYKDGKCRASVLLIFFTGKIHTLNFILQWKSIVNIAIEVEERYIWTKCIVRNILWEGFEPDPGAQQIIPTLLYLVSHSRFIECFYMPSTKVLAGSIQMNKMSVYPREIQRLVIQSHALISSHSWVEWICKSNV